MSPRKEVVPLVKGPKPVGLYSQAVKVGNLLFISGQIGQNPETGKLVKGDVEREVIQVFENLKNILEESGTSMENLLKVTIFVKDISIFNVLQKVRPKYFKAEPPASTLAQVSNLVFDANIEMDAVAWIP